MITRAAIMIDSTIYSLPQPNRHCDVIRYAINDGAPSVINGIHGFMTDGDQFLDRRQAHDHALACGQVYEGNLVREGSLSTDDLW